ncbi:DNA polymerase I [Acanthopleuribacter pedis]|uniref:DNA polymerase I n=1 Tax=Acanthopleuribacter pedis TaxID=442870 RepID=A0A8J7QMR3_9BACT|nr:DNA polymerase I [Acanthopleuribacter pedis]MBO1321248.1 DNA polymerase I [Acanthopleuribacter pedis]
MTRERFFIVDAFAHIFRSFYAIRNIDNNAVYGFTMMLRKLIADENPEYLAIAFDTSEPTFRKELYPEYKANRDAMPESLVPQIPLIKEMIEGYNIPMVAMPGFEADDIIGTLAKRAAEQGVQAVIVSGDKDMLQLVQGDDIVMFDPKKGVHYLGEAGIPEFFGCRPNQIIDLLSIWGDSADNIPGVKGVGEKGAKKYLAEYGSLDGIYENLDKITAKRARTGFEEARETIDLTKTLITIRTDLDLTFDKDTYVRKEPDANGLRAFFTRLDFKSLVDATPPKLKRISRDYQLLDTEERLKEVLAEIRDKGFFVFDIETTSLNTIEAELVGMALATEVNQAYYVPLRHEGQDATWSDSAEALLKDVLADTNIIKCAHNAKYDISVLFNLGWDVAGRIEDTMLMSYLINPNEDRHGMDHLAEKLLNYRTIHFDEVAGSGKDMVTFDKVPLDKACNYAAEDADITFQLYDILFPRLKEQDLHRVYDTVERPLIPVLARVENSGVQIDEGYLKTMSAKMAEEIEALEQAIYELAGEEFNIKSTKQLGVILFEKLGLPTVKKTSKTKSYSTDQSVLETLSAKGHALPAKLLEYRMFTKLKSTYVDALPTMICPKTGRVHSSFNQFVAATGRLSSNNPNLQNIPIRTEMGRDIRAAFVPRDGWVFVAADYSQIELRLMAHFSGDDTLVQGFRSGEDIHRRTAGEIMDVDVNLVTDDMRRAAKSINFGLIYGMGEFRLAQELGITRKKAREYMETYFEKMPRVLGFRDEVIEKAREIGEIRTYFGRHRQLPELASRNKNLQAQGERLAVNTLIQGTAAEIIKIAMIRLDEAIREQDLQAKLLLQVHDELVLECPEEEKEVVSRLLGETMEHVVHFEVPLVAEVRTGTNWKETK